MYLSALELREETSRQGLCVAPETRVERGLTTARLAPGEIQVHAQSPEHPDDALPHIGIELVDDAGDEKGRLDGRGLTGPQNTRLRTTKPAIHPMIKIGPLAKSKVSPLSSASPWSLK